MRLARSRALAAGRRFRSPSVTGHGGSLSRTGGPSTSRRCRVGSRTTSRAGTSRSTRWPVRSRAASSSIPSAGSATSPSARSARSLTASSRRPATPAACRPAGGRARLPARRRDGAARPPARGACVAPGGRADPRRARAALHGRLPAPRRSWACSTRWAARRSCSTGSTSPTRPSTASCACSASGCGGFRSRAASTVRPHAARRRAAARRFTARDPPLPARDGAVGARRARLRGAARACARRSSRPAPPIPRRRCCAATSSACRRAPRSAGCSS